MPLTNRLAFSDFGRDLDYTVCEGEFLGLAVAPGDADRRNAVVLDMFYISQNGTPIAVQHPEIKK